MSSARPLSFALVLACCAIVGAACAGDWEPSVVDLPRSPTAGSEEADALELMEPEATATPAPTSTPDPNLLLPDVIALEPDELYVANDEATGRRELRFSSITANVGRGPLELLGSYDPETGRTIATQRVLTLAGTYSDRWVGDFVFHPEHDHWHFEQYTQLALWSYDESGALGERLATTDKLSFCLLDEVRMDGFPEEVASIPMFLDCLGDYQGLSVGWTDTYPAELPGQDLDIHDLPDGVYAIESTVDPQGLIQESDEGNNTVITYVEIAGMSLTVLPAPG